MDCLLDALLILFCALMFNAIIHVPFSRKIIRDSHDLISENEFSFLASSKLFDFFFRLPLSVMLSDSYVSVLKMTENKAEQIAISEMFKHHICVPTFNSLRQFHTLEKHTAQYTKRLKVRHGTSLYTCQRMSCRTKSERLHKVN